LLNYSLNNRLIDNNASYNGYDGVHLFDSDYTTIIGGDASHNRNGIVLGSKGYTKDGCKMKGNQEYDVNFGSDVEDVRTKPEAEKEPDAKQYPEKLDGNGRHDLEISPEISLEEPEEYWEISGEKIRKWLGHLVFEPSKNMTVNVPEEVVVRIAKKETMDNLKRGFAEEAKVRIEEIEVADCMSVDLTGEKGVFDIEPITPKEQVIADTGYTEWQWWVTPLEEGVHNLSLTICPVIKCEKLGIDEPMCGSPIERMIIVNAVPWPMATINFIKSE